MAHELEWPIRVELLRSDNEWVPFVLHRDGTVYEQRYEGDRRVHEPELIAMVREQAVVEESQGHLR